MNVQDCQKLGNVCIILSLKLDMFGHKEVEKIIDGLKDINFNNSILVLQGAGDIKDIMSTLKRKHDR